MAYRCLSNLHTHTVYGDGSAPPEEYIQAALQKGFTSIGFSEHAYAPYDMDCCIREEETQNYMDEVRMLQERYKGQIDVYLGFESDVFCPAKREMLDYVIGSVHYVRDEKGKEHCIDYKAEQFEGALQNAGGGDIRELVRLYYATVARMALEQKPDIIGHFDLIGKLNSDNRWFNPKDKWYEAVVEEALDHIRQSGCMMELNTAGMRRAFTDEPYPSSRILRMMRSANIPVIISSDAHSPDLLDFGFDRAALLVRASGYRSLRQISETGFIDVEL